jgi:DNA-binding CsgD family transcriptional regulator
MGTILFCVVSSVEQLRLSLTTTLSYNYNMVLSLKEIDIAFYKQHLLHYSQLCLILPQELITRPISEAIKANGHFLIPIVDAQKPVCKSYEIFITANDTSIEILNKISAVVSNKKMPESVGALSEREVEVLKYIAKGCSNKEIANILFLSPHTVITHRKNITAKLNIKSISGLTVYAILQGIISIDEAEV